MEKWKIGVIVALIVGFGTLQWYSNGGQKTGNDAPGEMPNRPGAAPTPLPELVALTGKTPHAWNIPKNLWMNTPKPITLSDLKGSVALIEFWRLNCDHCREAVPILKQIYHRYKGSGPKGSGLKMVTFQSPSELTAQNAENRWADVQKFVRSNTIPYPVAFDAGRKLKDKYNIQWYPMVLLLDRQGRIQYAQTGHTPEKERELMQMIERMLQKK